MSAAGQASELPGIAWEGATCLENGTLRIEGFDKDVFDMPLMHGFVPPEKKSHKRLPGRERAETGVHFGVNVRSGPKHGLNIDRDSYALISKRATLNFPREFNPASYDSLDEDYEDEDHRIHTDEWCAAQQAAALENFDLNMAFFKTLDPE